MVVVAFGEIDHNLLGIFRQIAHPFGRRSGIPGKGRHHGLGSQDGVVLYDAAILEDAAPTDGNVLADVDVAVDDGGVDDGVFANVDVVADLEGKKGHALAELFERGPDDRFAADNAVSAHSDVG